MRDKVLVAGIGNIFLGDDAFGVEVVNRLTQRALPGNVCVADFGIRSYDLAYALMEDWELVILVDALPRGGEPGTLYIFEPDLPVEGEMPASLDAHTMNPVAVLRMVSSLGGQVKRLLVVGCEPETVEPDGNGNIGLSQPVSGATDEAINVVEGILSRMGSEVKAA